MATPEALRQRAQRLRELDSRPVPKKPDGIELASVSSGAEHRLIAIWQQKPGRPPALSLRIWRELPDGGLVPRRDLGLEIPAYRLPIIAEAIARAMELAEDEMVTFRAERDRDRGRR